MLGRAFQPGMIKPDAPNTQNGAPSGGGASPVQEAIQLLALRLPSRAQGSQGIVAPSLASAPGSAGLSQAGLQLLKRFGLLPNLVLDPGDSASGSPSSPQGSGGAPMEPTRTRIPTPNFSYGGGGQGLGGGEGLGDGLFGALPPSLPGYTPPPAPSGTGLSALKAETNPFYGGYAPERTDTY